MGCTMGRKCVCLHLAVALVIMSLSSNYQTNCRDFTHNILTYSKQMSIELVAGYVLAWLNTYFHELGHASLSYAFTGHPAHIHIGSSSPAPTLIETPFATINGFSAFNGYTSTRFFTHWQRILINIAGPLLGILFLKSVLYSINPIYQKLTLPCKVFLRALYHMHILQLIPFKHTGESDGYHILESLGIHKSTLATMQTYTEIPLNILIGAFFSFGPIFESVKTIAEKNNQMTLL